MKGLRFFTRDGDTQKRGLSREAAAESSQGQARSAPPLEQFHQIVLRPGGAQRSFRYPLKTAVGFLRTPSGCDYLFHILTRGVALTRAPLATFFHSFGVSCAVALTVFASATSLLGQPRPYPQEIRGYKVERAAVEMKAPEKANSSGGANSDAAVDQLITFGRPQLARVTPLGITFEVPIVVAPVKQKGRVDFLLFEDMAVNSHSVEIDEYHRAFDLPTKKALTLQDPLRFYIFLPVAALAAVDEWSNSIETWPVTGRVFVCGKFKKFLFSFKRCVPVELDLTMRNPLRERS
jgi:hypothetical protein